MENNQIVSLDALLPPEMAARAEQAGVRKAGLDWIGLFVLGVLAGAFIGLGGVFSTTVTAGTASAFPYGVTRLLAGLVFTLGLVLVIVGGAELFTGNNLIVMAWASRQVSTRGLLRNWGIVYAGNFLGSVLTALLVFLSGQYLFGGGEVGRTALAIADTKVSYSFIQAVALGILCNALVCLAVWLTMSARTTTDRILAIIPPIAAFVAAGFEHSVANMYFIPFGLMIKNFASEEFWTLIGGDPAQYADLTWQSFLVSNLLPVTVGNIIGGTLLVGIVYWFIYLRKRGKPVSV
ncbi:MAG TPA: formate transporter FocA [Anaerolineales bacterium]|nr:formate transporter FocA [Anaerolineales bacterium]